MTLLIKLKQERNTYIKDVRLRRGAEINSDHFLLVQNFGENNKYTALTKAQKLPTNVTINAYKLRNGNISLQIENTLDNELKEWLGQDTSLEAMWEKFKFLIIGAAKQVCGVKFVEKNNKESH